MNHYKSSAELKASAKEHMFGKYGVAIGAELLTALIVGFANSAVTLLTDLNTLGGTIIYYLITLILSVLAGLFISGTCYFYLKIICERPVTVGDIFYGFKLYPDKAISMMAWISVLTYLSMLPMIILSYRISKATPINNTVLAISSDTDVTSLLVPYSLALIFTGVVSVIISLLYSQAFFLLHDFPQYSARELLVMSRKLITGHKGRLFYIYASFIPLFLLSLISCGIAFLWVIPYMNATLTEFFLDIIKNSKN